MKHYITITKTLSYDIDEIMGQRGCDRETAVEIAFEYFDEAAAEGYEEYEEEND